MGDITDAGFVSASFDDVVKTNDGRPFKGTLPASSVAMVFQKQDQTGSNVLSAGAIVGIALLVGVIVAATADPF